MIDFDLFKYAMIFKGIYEILKILNFTSKLFRRYFLRKLKLFRQSNKDLKWVLVTGVTDGLGLEIVKILIKKNIGVILFGRNPDKIIKLRKFFAKENFKKFYILQIDQGLFETTEFVDQLTNSTEHYPPLNYLINNAGQFKISHIKSTPYSTYTSYFNVNFLSHLLITNNFLIRNGNFNQHKMNVAYISSSYSLMPVPHCTFHSFLKFLGNKYFRFLRLKL